MRPKIIAHRGLSSLYPENTFIAFEKALELPVDAIEFDVHPTRDHKLVLTHDDSLERCSNGSGAVRNHTLAELRELDFGAWKKAEFTGTRIPTFQELLDKALELRPDLYFCVELKENDKECARQVIDELRRRELFGQCSIISFHNEMLFYTRELEPRAFLHGFVPRWPERITDPIMLRLFQRVGVSAGNLLPELIEYYHGCGIEVDSWAADDAETLRKMLDAKVDTITTNAPQVILPLLALHQ